MMIQFLNHEVGQCKQHTIPLLQYPSPMIPPFTKLGQRFPYVRIRPIPLQSPQKNFKHRSRNLPAHSRPNNAFITMQQTIRQSNHRSQQFIPCITTQTPSPYSSYSYQHFQCPQTKFNMRFHSICIIPSIQKQQCHMSYHLLYKELLLVHERIRATIDIIRMNHKPLLVYI